MEKKEEHKKKLPFRYSHDTLAPMATYRSLVYYYFLKVRKKQLLSNEEKRLFFRNWAITNKLIENRNARFAEVMKRAQAVLDSLSQHGGPHEVMSKLDYLNELLTDINEKRK